MSQPSKRIGSVLFASMLVALTASAVLAKDVTIAYPSPQEPVFSVSAPEAWEMTPGEEEGDYFLLEGPTGAVLSFRAIEGTKEDLDEAIKSAETYLEENYDKVKIGEAKEQGKDAFYASGTGVFKDGGVACTFELTWFLLPSGQIAEIWYEAAKDDSAGLKQAKKILATYKTY